MIYIRIAFATKIKLTDAKKKKEKHIYSANQLKFYKSISGRQKVDDPLFQFKKSDEKFQNKFKITTQ